MAIVAVVVVLVFVLPTSENPRGGVAEGEGIAQSVEDRDGSRQEVGGGQPGYKQAVGWIRCPPS